MHVLFLLLYHPKPNKSSNLYSELIDEFIRNGHKVTVVSADNEEEEASTLNIENGLELLRVKTPRIFNVHPLQKGIATIKIPYLMKKAIKKHLSDRKFDLIVFPTPPITFVDIIAWLKNKYHIKLYLILRDIFPQNARDLGMINNSLLFNYFRRKEKRLYRYSDYIGCMSQGNIDYVIRHNPEVPVEKLYLLPNWQRLFPIQKKDETVKEKHGLSGKYIALFGGNIGEPQQIENIVELADEYHDNPDIVFLIIGNGAKKGFLKQLVSSRKLNNILIKDELPRSEYMQLACAADVGLISLNEKFTIPNIPSKTISYFNASVPILAITDPNTDYGKILEEAGAGLWSLAGDLKKYKDNFDRLYNDPELRRQMGENGYRYFADHLTPEKTYERMMKVIGKS